MIEESRLNEYYGQIAEKLDEMVPCEWEKIVLYVEESEENSFFDFYFYNKEGKAYRWTDIPNEYYGEFNMEEFGICLKELEQINKNFWMECRDSDEGTWNSFVFLLNSEWKFNIKFGYERNDKLSEFEKKIRWAYDELGIVPELTIEGEVLEKYLMEQGRELPEKLIDKTVRYEQKIVLKDTPEKYEKTADELIAFLLEFLGELNQLEEEIYIRDEKLVENKYKEGIPRHIVAPGSKELFAEYKERFGELAKDRCTAALLAQGYAGSYGNPTKYGYINGDFQLIFTMKSAKRAVIETRHYGGIEMKHQFVLKLTDEGWRVSERKYGFGNKTTWYKEGI